MQTPLQQGEKDNALKPEITGKVPINVDEMLKVNPNFIDDLLTMAGNYNIRRDEGLQAFLEYERKKNRPLSSK